MEPVIWLRPEYQGRENELINLAAGADMAGVTRSAVSNWAARHANFPKLVMLTGSERKRVKWVVRDEFLTFARGQLNKPRRGPHTKHAPRRPRAEILAERIAHWETQIGRLADLEARQGAAVERTRTLLERARGELQSAQAGFAAEVDAVNALIKEPS